jgi:hypothetical protein
MRDDCKAMEPALYEPQAVLAHPADRPTTDRDAIRAVYQRMRGPHGDLQYVRRYSGPAGTLNCCCLACL